MVAFRATRRQSSLLLVYPGVVFNLLEVHVFADPQSITYATVEKSLPAISRSETQSDYRLNDSGVNYTLSLSHQFKNRNRVVARLRRDSTVSDPLIPTQNIPAGMTATLTIDFPTSGLLPEDAQSLGKALVTWCSDSNLLKLINGET